ncbi:uncharacterized protein LOC131151520 [Malania oleifera]|uniref:uncharacterized protein LOC131151520 n=1 Tax=Malania oleifera TaxID=397392 RepID=UPI0025AE1070|nr:uncharacterized protein LOC131151520 [Malania oleifera]
MVELGCSIDQFTQLKPLAFVASADPIRIENWIREIEKILDVLNCTEKQKVAFAMFKLTSEAQRWWESVKMLEKHQPIPVVMTWTRFRDIFFERYFPAMVRNAKMEEFMSLTQGQLIVQQYSGRFQELSQFAPFMIPDEILKKRPVPPSSSAGATQGNWKKNNNSGAFHSTSTTPDCPTCGKKHFQDCRRSTWAFFWCGKLGHRIKDSSLLGNSGAPQ